MSDSNMSDGYGDCRECQYYEKREHSYIEQIKSLQAELDQQRDTAGRLRHEVADLTQQLAARDEEMGEARILMCDIAKLPSGDGTDMYTCTMTADEWLHRVDRLLGQIAGVYKKPSTTPEGE